MLRTNLRYSLPSTTDKRVFLVTSPGPVEGKSTIVLNLAVVMAQAGQWVIVVDADMRRPRMHKLLGCRNVLGLSSLLVGEVESIEQVLQPTETDALQLLPCGTIPPNPAELLASPRMSELLEQLSERADVILVDSPPLLAVTDAGILASIVTGTILVVQAGRTKLGACAYGMEALERVGGKALGVVLNGLNVGRRGYYNNYLYQYHYSYSHDDEPGNGEDAPLAKLAKHLPWTRKKGREKHAEEE